MRFLAQQSIPKIDDLTANCSVLLRENDDGTYSTHIRNDDTGGLLHGHYRLSLPEAWADFGKRVLQEWPTLGGALVPFQKKDLVPVEKLPRKLVQPLEIHLIRAEGPTERVSIPVGKRIVVGTYNEANDVIRRIARTAPDNGTCDKTDFKIIFADGFAYTGQFEVVRKDMHRSGMLEQQVREFMQFVVGEYRPDHTRGKGEAQWKALMAEYEADGSAQQAREFLAEYDVGQAVK